MSSLLPLAEPLRLLGALTAEHRDLEGHFPGFAILPAVSQVDLLLDALSAHYQLSIICTGIPRAKFKAMLRPATEFEICIKSAGENRIQWVIENRDAIFSQGTMIIAEAPSADILQGT